MTRNYVEVTIRVGDEDVEAAHTTRWNGERDQQFAVGNCIEMTLQKLFPFCLRALATAIDNYDGDLDGADAEELRRAEALFAASRSYCDLRRERAAGTLASSRSGPASTGAGGGRS